MLRLTVYAGKRSDRTEGRLILSLSRARPREVRISPIMETGSAWTYRAFSLSYWVEFASAAHTLPDGR